MRREFLGWEGALLAKAAAWLIGEFGAQMEGVVVALPGARSGRILEELLAREVGAGLVPPKVVTAGVLSDELLEVEGVAAGRVVRTLAWERALMELPEAELERIVARPPGAEERGGLTTLAEEVRGLFGEVAAEGLDFEAVSKSALLDELEGEQRRWRALGAAQAGMAKLLEEAGLHDPHLGRLAALEAQQVRRVRHVVLVGVVEMNELLRRALTLCESKQSTLIFAPEAESESFDALGCLRPEAWAERTTSLETEQWRVVDRPVDQAQEAARVIAGWGGKYSAEQISVGLADAEVSPYLKSRLAESGVRARDAAGVAMGRTPAVRLLAAVSGFLRSHQFGELSALVRHPDFEWALLRIAGGTEPIDCLDDYHEKHLPWRADGEWSAEDANKYDQALRARMNEVWRAVREVLGELMNSKLEGLAEQTAAVRSFLERVYGTRDLDARLESGRVSIASLRCLASGLAELEEVPASLSPEGSTADTIEHLLRIASNRSNDVAPSGARAGEPTMEMMGWLELPLDDAPALVVTGFEDGKVPESVRGDAYLPNRLRQDLGLVDNTQRLARDLYATELLLNSREEIAFITGRRNLAGDAQVPSRVVFHCAEDEVTPRVRRFLSGHAPTQQRIEPSEAEDAQLPRGGEVDTPRSITVSAFKTFLDSPYAYYLRHVLKLDTLDDRSREMDGAAFGNLAHTVLHRFGLDERARDERDEEKIATFLVDALEKLAIEIYGKRPLPAVQLQLEQLKWRLRKFAGKQAKRRADGWCIHAVEWAPEGGSLDFFVDGEAIQLRGRIDRIDRHELTGEWAVWDYKTGDTISRPLSAHRRPDGSWKDLQLPLYSLLVADLIEAASSGSSALMTPALGYIALGRDDKTIGFWPVDDWRKPKDEFDEDEREEALGGGLAEAHGVVRRIRAGDWFDPNDWKPYDQIFEAICGVGTVASAGAALGADEEVGA